VCVCVCVCDPGEMSVGIWYVDMCVCVCFLERYSVWELDVEDLLSRVNCKFLKCADRDVDSW